MKSFSVFVPFLRDGTAEYRGKMRVNERDWNAVFSGLNCLQFPGNLAKKKTPFPWLKIQVSPVHLHHPVSRDSSSNLHAQVRAIRQDFQLYAIRDDACSNLIARELSFCDLQRRISDPIVRNLLGDPAMSAAISSSQLPNSIRCATAYGYGRQSHRDQIDAAEGIPQQGVRTKAYFSAQLETLGVKWGGFIPDESAVSARTNPFMLRHAGKLLFDLLQPGDHFIVDKVDRLWRSVADFVDVRRMFEQRKVTLHICNLMGATSVQLGTPAGDFLMNIMVAGAQMESDQCSDRTRARFAGRRAEGRYPGSRPPMGCKLIGNIQREGARVVQDTRKFAWCLDRRGFMKEIVRLADMERMNCTDIRRVLVSHFRKIMSDRFVHDEIAGKDWPAYSIAKHYWREKQYQALPAFDPNRIKFEIFNPSGSGKKYRDIGRGEPQTPNTFPFLDGRSVPTVEELYCQGQIAS